MARGVKNIRISRPFPVQKIIVKKRTQVARKQASRAVVQKPEPIPTIEPVVVKQEKLQKIENVVDKKTAIVEINKKYSNGMQIKYRIPIAGSLENLGTTEQNLVKLFEDNNLCSIEANKVIEDQ